MFFRLVSAFMALVLLQVCTGMLVMASGQYQYEYDKNNRLTGIKKNGAYVQKFNYDSNGNLLSTSIEGKPLVNLAYPDGDQANPSAMESTNIPIAWQQTSDSVNGVFDRYQIEVRDESDMLVWDSGTQVQNTALSDGAFDWSSGLPLDTKYKLRVRVSAAQIWSSWSDYRWFILSEPEDQNNLIKNGSFEKAVTDENYTWSNAVDASGTGQITTVNTPVTKGGKALKIEASGLAAWTRNQVTQSAAVEAGKTYVLSGDLNAVTLQNAYAELQIRYFSASNVNLGQEYVRHEAPSPGYVHLEKRTTAPEGAVRAQVYVWLTANGAGNGGGLMYADNIDLRETTDANLLTNADFEHAAGTGTAGWQSGNSGTGTIGWVNTPTASGTKAMKLDVAGLAAWQKGYVRQRVNVKGGEPFTLSGQLHAEQLNGAYGQLVVWFYDENWTNLGEFKVELNQTTSGYVALKTQGVIPAGTVLAEVAVHVVANQANGAGTVYADALSFAYGNDDDNGGENDGNLLGNGSFEKFSGLDIAAWVPALAGPGTGEVTTVTEPVTKGSKALKIEASGLAAWTRNQVSQSAAVEAGKTYVLSGDLNAVTLQNAYAELQIRYFSASNVNLGQEYVRHEAPSPGYVHLEKRTTAPEGAVRAQMYVWLTANGAGNGGGLMYADNIDLRETTDANLLTNADFEHAAGTGTAGWQSGNSGTGTIGWVNTPTASGTKAMKLDVAGLAAWQKGYVRQRVNVKGGEPFTLSGQLHAEQLNGAYGQLVVWFYDENWTNLGEFKVELNQTTSGYVALETQGVIPAGTVLAEVAVHVVANQANGAGTVYADNLNFTYAANDLLEENELLVPQNIQIFSTFDDEVGLSWDVDGQPQSVAYYQVLNHQSVIASVYEPQLMVSVEDGLTYQFTVVSVNQSGERSDESEALVYVHEAMLQPITVTASRTSEAEAQLTWTTTIDSDEIEAYEVWVNGAFYDTAAENSMSIQDLFANVLYEVRVRVVLHSGDDLWSDTISLPSN